jgi:hypothetical protein
MPRGKACQPVRNIWRRQMTMSRILSAALAVLVLAFASLSTGCTAATDSGASGSSTSGSSSGGGGY